MKLKDFLKEMTTERDALAGKVEPLLRQGWVVDKQARRPNDIENNFVAILKKGDEKMIVAYNSGGDDGPDNFLDKIWSKIRLLN